MVAADRNLLFGILALQMDFVERDALIAAMNAWVLRKDQPLGEILVQQGALAEDERRLLDAAGRQATGSPRRRCRAQSGLRSRPRLRCWKALESVADFDVQASLAQVGAARTQSRPPARGAE